MRGDLNNWFFGQIEFACEVSCEGVQSRDLTQLLPHENSAFQEELFNSFGDEGAHKGGTI